MRYKLTIEYDGTPYRGWQRQHDAPSVQQTIEHALFQFCQQQVSLTAAGRTDAGVHAYGQVAHVDITLHRSCFVIRDGLNAWLRHEAISIVTVEEVSDIFHARFDATMRHYEYHIIMRRAPSVLHSVRAWHVPYILNLDAMQEAGNHLLGYHDFSSFRDSQCQAKSPMRSIDRLEITQRGEHITLHIEAISFLHHQVRIITGTLVDIGREKYPPSAIKDILAAATRPAAGVTAPPYGLYFMHVDY